MPPLVSVIIPTYNREKLIPRAIDSVLQQTFRDFEIIVIDDGSQDATRSVLAPYMAKIRYFYQENAGISAARNKGIREALGQYIAFLDSDDVWIAQKLALQTAVLEEHERIGLVYSKMTKIDENNQPCGTKPEGYIGKDFQELMVKGGDLPTSSVIVRKACFEQAGLFDESLAIMEDIEMWIRIAKDWQIYQIAEPHLVFYYCHGGQVTKNKIKVLSSTVMLNQKFLRLYDNIPHALIRKRLAAGQYVLSREYYLQNQIKLSFDQLLGALGHNPWVGLSFIEPKDSLIIKILKLFKPYIFFCLCALKRMGS